MWPFGNSKNTVDKLIEKYHSSYEPRRKDILSRLKNFTKRSAEENMSDVDNLLNLTESFIQEIDVLVKEVRRDTFASRITEEQMTKLNSIRNTLSEIKTNIPSIRVPGKSIHDDSLKILLQVSGTHSKNALKLSEFINTYDIEFDQIKRDIITMGEIVSRNKVDSESIHLFKMLFQDTNSRLDSIQSHAKYFLDNPVNDLPDNVKEAVDIHLKNLLEWVTERTSASLNLIVKYMAIAPSEIMRDLIETGRSRMLR